MSVIIPKKLMIIIISSLLLICLSLILILLNNSNQEYSIQYEQDTSDASSILSRVRYYLNFDSNIEEQPKDNEINKHDLLHGDVIMPELGDPVVRAELGRATWHVLHSITSRFPENPTE